MGMILPWPVQQDRTGARKRFRDEPTGELVFFTGVRYERAPAEPAPGPTMSVPHPTEHDHLEPRRA